MVGEMRVILAPVDAETGRGAGQVQILTRSGTNKYQGSAVWNAQNSALNANTWNNNRTGADKTWFNRQQLSVNYAGPIIKNKTFFFALFDGQRMYSRENVLATVLTQQARAGNFRFFPGVVNGPADSPVTGGAIRQLQLSTDWEIRSGLRQQPVTFKPSASLDAILSVPDSTRPDMFSG